MFRNTFFLFFGLIFFQTQFFPNKVEELRQKLQIQYPESVNCIYKEQVFCCLENLVNFVLEENWLEFLPASFEEEPLDYDNINRKNIKAFLLIHGRQSQSNFEYRRQLFCCIHAAVKFFLDAQEKPENC